MIEPEIRSNHEPTHTRESHLLSCYIYVIKIPVNGHPVLRWVGPGWACADRPSAARVSGGLWSSTPRHRLQYEREAVKLRMVSGQSYQQYECAETRADLSDQQCERTDPLLQLLACETCCFTCKKLQKRISAFSLSCETCCFT